MTRLEFEQEKTKRMAALAEAMKCGIHPYVADFHRELIQVCQSQYGETFEGYITIPENEKPV